MLIDLTIPFHNRTVGDDPMPYTINYVTPAQAFMGLPKQGLDQAFFPDNQAWAVESVDHLATHAGTHVDYPYHYGSPRSGAAAITSDDIPLEAFLDRPGVCLNFSHKAAGSVIAQAEMANALTAIHYTLRPGDVVLIRTGASDFYDEPGYWTRHVGMSAEATQWLVDTCGIQLVGIDAWGWDQAFDTMGQAALAAGNPDAFWGAHKVGRTLPYCQIENLAHLDRLPAKGFQVSCVPLAIAHASAAWARVFARVEEAAAK